MTRTYRRCPLRGCWVGLHYWNDGVHSDNPRPLADAAGVMAVAGCLNNHCARTRVFRKHAVFRFRTGRHAPVLHRDGAWCDARGQHIQAKRIYERRAIRHRNRVLLRRGGEVDVRDTEWLD